VTPPLLSAEEILAALNEHGVDYAVIGAFAAIAQGAPIAVHVRSRIAAFVADRALNGRFWVFSDSGRETRPLRGTGQKSVSTAVGPCTF
jgi:hypothetical protein